MVVFVLIDTAGACRIAARCAAIRCPRYMRIELYLRIAVYVSVPLGYMCVCDGWLTYTVDACQIAARTRGRCMELFLLARRRMELLLLEKLLLLLVSSNAVLNR